MAKCEKCGEIRLEDAACGNCGGSLYVDGRYVHCPICGKDVGGVCNGRCGITAGKIIKFAAIGIGVIVLLKMCININAF